LLYAILEAEANARVATKPLTARLVGGEEQEFGYSTVLVARTYEKPIPDRALSILKDAAAKGARVFPVASSLTREGLDLGSREFRILELPRVILVTGSGIPPYDASEICHMVDRRIQMPITMVDQDRLGSVDLRDYTHVLTTSGLNALNDSGFKKLKTFVESGGILRAQGDNPIKWVIDKELAKAEWRLTEKEKAEKTAKDEKNGNGEGKEDPVKRLPFAQARDDAAFRLVRGAIFGASLDITHPIGYGYASEFLPVFRRSNRFFEPSSNPYSTPVLHTDYPLISGYVNEENRQLIAGSASIAIDQVGQGAVILALDNATFRAFWWGTQRLLSNAISSETFLKSPTRPIPHRARIPFRHRKAGCHQ
jgi:hypothetical protein